MRVVRTLSQIEVTGRLFTDAQEECDAILNRQMGIGSCACQSVDFWFRTLNGTIHRLK
jgi:hypothetical protein